MKKRIDKNKLIYITLVTLCALLIIALFLVFLLTDEQQNLADYVAVLATVIGAFASIIEYRRNNAIDMCNDIMTIYEKFLDVSTNKEIQYKLECLKRRDINLFTEDDISGIRNYLLYFNGVAEKIFANDIKISSINTILGYRFFLIMNCPYIQDLEIIPNANTYRPCIELHNKWRIWSEKHHFKRSGDATSLEKRFDEYFKYANLD